MKTIKYLTLSISLMYGVFGFAQGVMHMTSEGQSPVRELTTEPGFGIHTNFGTDLLFTNLIQWNLRRHLTLAAHFSFNINNLTQRYFNGIKTNYNFSINQKFGIGTTIYSKRRSHTFLLMVGGRYTTYRETLDDERFDPVVATVSSFSPDYGLMYSLKRGWKNYFLTYRIYIPLYPWPIKDSDKSYLRGNMDNVALEIGIGMKIK